MWNFHFNDLTLCVMKGRKCSLHGNGHDHLGRKGSSLIPEVIKVSMFVKHFITGSGWALWGLVTLFYYFFPFFRVHNPEAFTVPETSMGHSLTTPHLCAHLVVDATLPPAATSLTRASKLCPLISLEGRREKGHQPPIQDAWVRTQEKKAHWLQLSNTLLEAMPLRLRPLSEDRWMRVQRSGYRDPTQDHYERPFCFQSLISYVL